MSEPIHVRARKFLQQFFNDEELTTFSFDYFPQVYNNFTRGMTKNEMVLELVAHSQRRGRFDELLAALERERPKSYADHFAEQPHLIELEPQESKKAKRNLRQIFISYANQDDEFARRLAIDLHANGWETWTANENIRPGEKWVEAINRGLTESGVFALVLTPDSVASRWVQSEMNAAIGMEHRGEIRLIPLYVKPTSTPALWSAYQWITFENDYGTGLKSFLNELAASKQPKLDTKTVNFHPPEQTKHRNSSQSTLPNIVANQRIIYFLGGILLLAVILLLAFWPDPENDSVAEPTGVDIAKDAETGEESESETETTPQTIAETEVVPTVTETASPSRTPAPTPTVDPAIPPNNAELGDRWSREQDNMVMVFVPGGMLLMGSSPEEIESAIAICEENFGDTDCLGAYEDEGPKHEISLTSFWIDRTEVTNEQYSLFLNDLGNQGEGGVTWLEIDDPDVQIEATENSFRPKDGFENHPVNNVSWYGAAAYCLWTGGSLPTEAQWEYAARGNNGNIFPWGNQFDGTRANYCDVNCSQTWTDVNFDDGFIFSAPVGNYSPFGNSWVDAVDMAGNAWEWVSDWYDPNYYENSSSNNPTGPVDGEFKVLRGGGWNNSSLIMRTTSRFNDIPSLRGDRYGFRCVVSLGIQIDSIDVDIIIDPNP